MDFVFSGMYIHTHHSDMSRRILLFFFRSGQIILIQRIHMKTNMTIQERMKSTSFHRIKSNRENALEAIQSIIESRISILCVQRGIFPENMFQSVHDDHSKLLLFDREMLASHRKSKIPPSDESDMCLSSLSWGDSLNTWVDKANIRGICAKNTRIVPSLGLEWQKTEAQIILDWLENGIFNQMTQDQTNQIIFSIVRGSDDTVLEQYEVS